MLRVMLTIFLGRVKSFLHSVVRSSTPKNMAEACGEQGHIRGLGFTKLDMSSSLKVNQKWF